MTLVANYLPLQDPYGGPNYFKLDPNAVYEIHVTNGGGAVENLTFQFKFQTTNDDNAVQRRRQDGLDPARAERQFGRVDPATRRRSTCTRSTRSASSAARAAAAPRRRSPTSPAGGTTFDKPVDYIGTKTIGNYVAYANQHIYDIGIPGCGTGRVFVGQRKDPFVVNLGETFDLVNIKYPAVELNPPPSSRRSTRWPMPT